MHRTARHGKVGLRILAALLLVACTARWAAPGEKAAAQFPGQNVAAVAAPPARADADNAQWAVILDGFFPGLHRKSNEPQRLNCYLVRQEGKWTAALGTATNQGRPNWNTAMMLIDPKQAVVQGDRLTGTLEITLVPDPWVPKDQKPRRAVVTLDARLGAQADEKYFAPLSGKWSATVAGGEAELKEAGLSSKAEGPIIGGVGPVQPRETADASYDLQLYNLIPGQTKENFQRRRALSLGVKAGKIVSARFGQLDIRHTAYDYTVLDTPDASQVDADHLSTTVSFTTDTLDGEQVSFAISLSGQRVSAFVAGTWNGKYTDESGKEHPVDGFFRGNTRPGAYETTVLKDTRPWFASVKDFKAVQPGEHPRLFFRKGDVPELRRRAATPEGRQIVQRLRQLLNGSDGESLPTLYNPAKLAYDKNKFKAAPGAYSISSAAGFGFLYQLTGEKKYAALARQCVEKGWEGQRDFDDRYAWVAPGGELRAGPSIAWTAVAYDLCYDAWDEAFRVKAAQAIQNYADTRGGEWNQAEGITLQKMVLQPRQGPGSNHFGAVVGGSGLAVLAIKDDPGTDRQILAKYVEVLERQVVRHLSAGWGDGGYYKEGWGASQVGTQGGFLCFLQALKTAAGHDYLNVDRSNASFITMVPRALMLVGPPAVYPYRSNMGPTYGSPEFHRERAGFSHGGQFCEGFGAVADKYKPGLLWIFNHIVQADPAVRDFDTPSLYHFRPMLALVNWPTFSGIQEQNPAGAMPLATRDSLYDYFVFRNRWQDQDDVVTTVALNYADGTRPRNVMVWGLGTRNELDEPPRKAEVTAFEAGRDGSGVLSAGEWALAVDYSGASGADALVVTADSRAKGDKSNRKAEPKGAGKTSLATFTVEKAVLTVFTLSRDGKHPEAKIQGNRLTVGKQTVTYAGGKLTLGVFQPQR
jgi:VCBS repeat-containing protein